MRPDPVAPSSAVRAPRVAVVTTVHRWGDPRVFERETAAWIEQGCEVHVFVPAAGSLERRGWSTSPRLHLHTWPLPHGRAARMRLAFGVHRTVAAHGPFDLVHFHDPELVPAMAWLAARWRRAYFLYDVHEELPLEVSSKPWIPAGLRPVVRLGAHALWAWARVAFEGFAPATEAIARHWPAARTRIVHNYPRAVFEPPAGAPPAPDGDRVVYVGGLTEVRGIREMVAAVRTVRTRRPALRLELYGALAEASLEPVVSEAVREGWCVHTPWLPAEVLAERARGAGVGLLPYRPAPDHLEALPTKMFEYMAMGVPVLASDLPLWRALVHDSGAGRVAEPTAAAFAEALTAMLADPAALAVHAEHGRTAYRTRYRWEVERERLHWHLERARERMGA